MIYYIHGSEPYLVRKELHKLMDSKKAQGVDVNPIFYDGSDNKEFDMRIVVQEAQTFDLFAGYRMLIVQDLNLNGMSSNPLVKRNAEVLLEYAKNASPDSDLIIYGNITTKSKTFVKDLRKYAKEITCEQLKYPEFFAQVKEQLKKNNIVMKPRLMEEFASRLELDLGRLMNEIEKFKLYGKEIDKEALDALVYKPLDDDVFALMNAIYSSDFERAMKQWNDLCALNLSPVMLSAIMVSSVRSAYIAKIGASKGYGNDKIAKDMKTTEGRIYYLMKDARGFTAKSLVKMAVELGERNDKFRNGMIDTADQQLALELYIIRLMR